MVLNGPNLDRLGTRRPEIYGSTTLSELERMCVDWGSVLGIEVVALQSNHEGELIDHLHEADATGIVLNAGALTHYSYALRDAIESTPAPVVEVHISNVLEREEWRRRSVLAEVCLHSIYGRGIEGYRWAMLHLLHHAQSPPTRLEYGYHDEAHGDLRVPVGNGPFPAVMLLHGGFWRHQWTFDTVGGPAVDLWRRGFVTYAVEYRRVGAGGGATTTPADIEEALDVLRRHPRVDAERIAIVGHSAGGQLAVQAASRHVVQLAVSMAGVLDLETGLDLGIGGGAIEAYLGGAPARLHSPTRLVPTASPILAAHGSADDLVPALLSERFADAAAEAGSSCELHLLEEVGHFEFLDPSTAAWQAITQRISAAILQ